jgi:hypothetical protein
MSRRGILSGCRFERQGWEMNNVNNATSDIIGIFTVSLLNSLRRAFIVVIYRCHLSHGYLFYFLFNDAVCNSHWAYVESVDWYDD